MRPTLTSLHLGEHSFGLHTYGLFVALGFTVGIVLMWREGKRQGLDGGRLLDLAFWGIVAGLAGSRVTFVALNAREFLEACLHPASAPAIAEAGRIAGCTAALRFWEGGLVFYGGAIATGIVVLLFCQREGWSFWKLADVSAPTLAIGHAIGRLGCFFAGCCFGKACGAPWAVSFPPGSVAFEELQATGAIGNGAAGTPALHPTQLYEAAGELAIFALLLLLRRRWRAIETLAAGQVDGRPQRAGRLFLTYAISYAALRSIVEVFRGDAARRYVFEWTSARIAAALALPPEQPLALSVSQAVSLAVLACAVTMLIRRRSPTAASNR